VICTSLVGTVPSFKITKANCAFRSSPSPRSSHLQLSASTFPSHQRIVTPPPPPHCFRILFLVWPSAHHIKKATELPRPLQNLN
jgi:hypothetical protein